ncbi:DUF1588 domain-containing protein [Gemmata sp.]|uniref:DUF1588 domain-containing protein n=1 Tax=Gemmata sp. TaxID=1914242 RepID=UPI003F71EAC7
MNLRIPLLLAAWTAAAPPSLGAAPPGAAPDTTFVETVAPFLREHCVRCHNTKKQLGDVRLDDLASDPGPTGGERWLAVAVQIRDGLMPPPKEARPDAATARKVVAWVARHGGGRGPRLPNHGNLVPHELLFGQPVAEAGGSAARVWRLSPGAYMGLVADLARGKVPAGVVQPFTVIPERGIKDFAGLYTIDEPSAEILVRNAEAIVAAQTIYTVKEGKVTGGGNSVREFVTLFDPTAPPTKAQLETAIQFQYRTAVGRNAGAEEVKRLIELYERCEQRGDRPGAIRTMLQAVLLRTDALFRSELGAGSGRRMLAPQEIAVALSLALGNRRDSSLVTAAAKGELATKAQVANHVRRMLDDPKLSKPRVLVFFREYFEYDQALYVFKDKPRTFAHEPYWYVSDTDRLVLSILAADKDVFRELLTTDKSFVNYSTGKNKVTKAEEPKPGAVIPPKRDGKTGALTPIPGVEYVYGVEKWDPRQPMTLPPGTRLGILMQPSWLTAWSTNFDNDPVRRGRWIRERLLGGTVPDLPIGVVAQVPNDPHRTYRDRLSVTQAAECWKCHNKMDELALPFENFDHYGRFQTTEEVVDVEATERNVDKSGKSLGLVYKQVALSTAGAIADSGDPKLDGPVKDPHELVRKLAASDRARQVFIRHVFRFYLGRNETMSDAAVLQEADRAYLQSGGSFKALLVSLLTSDSFLYRTNTPPTKESK